MKLYHSKNKAGKVTKSRIIRAVASSTAIETGQPIQTIENQLKAGKSKFSNLKLAP